MAAAFNNLFRKKWFFTLFIAMLILLIVETSVIIFLIVVSGLGSQVFPALNLNWYATPGCSALAASVVSSTIENRTVEYSCPGGGAINIRSTFPHDLFSRYGPGPAVVLVVPTFSLPTGYLRLAIVDRAIGCASNQMADRYQSGQVLLRSGQNMTLGGGFANVYSGPWSYDYCSVIAGQSGSVDGFKISWREIPWPTDFVKVSASPPQLVVHEGQNVSTVITVTSPGMFSGNVTFSLGFESLHYFNSSAPVSSASSPTASISSNAVFLRRGGTNATTATVIAVPGSAPQTLIFTVFVYPGSGTAPGYAYYPHRAYVNIQVEII